MTPSQSDFALRVWVNSEDDSLQVIDTHYDKRTGKPFEVCGTPSNAQLPIFKAVEAFFREANTSTDATHARRHKVEVNCLAPLGRIETTSVVDDEHPASSGEPPQSDISSPSNTSLPTNKAEMFGSDSAPAAESLDASVSSPGNLSVSNGGGRDEGTSLSGVPSSKDGAPHAE